MKQIMKNGLLLCAFFGTALLFNSCKSENKKAECGANTTTCCKGLTIVAHVTVLPEFKDELLNAFQTIVAETRKEAGNISYGLYEDTSDSLKFTFVEVWKSQADIDAHNASAHFQTFVKQIEGKASLDVYILKQKF
ncbi:putative monooxygenase YcnE [termite gut metagenome]|uniref:Putative monooxygenase YcnE n=1 Tax=termite gut metagenome TaxID=433724 RepID=A0A5J4RR09_9ZZZZ